MARINFGYVLRKLRHNRDETLEQVSEATGLSIAMLSRIERGERLPSPDSVEVLAQHFGIPVDYLMSETIANRMVNRYGEASTKSAAEHMWREPAEQAPMDGSADEDEEAGVRAEQLESLRPQPRRRYGVFEEMDILSALQNPGVSEVRFSAVTPASAGPPEPEARADSTTSLEEQRALIDPATQHVLIAARRSTEAAAMLALRESRSLSPEARVEIINQLAAMVNQTADVLRSLAKGDPEKRVREAARLALNRLGRP